MLIFYLGTSILSLGHSAWAATLATEYHQRSRVFGVLAATGVVGAVVVLLIPILASRIGWSSAQGVRVVKMADDDKVAAACLVPETEEEDKEPELPLQ